MARFICFVFDISGVVFNRGSSQRRKNAVLLRSPAIRDPRQC